MILYNIDKKENIASERDDIGKNCKMMFYS